MAAGHASDHRIPLTSRLTTAHQLAGLCPSFPTVGAPHECAPAPTLLRYANFFALFGDFRGFVDFLLDDLVANDGSVKFFMPFDDFRAEPGGSAIPKDVDTYRSFRRRSIEFIESRNHRIEHLMF